MINPNDPILPQVMKEGGFTYGLTKREYFAALILNGILSNSLLDSAVEHSVIAERCCLQADALIKALNEDKK